MIQKQHNSPNDFSSAPVIQSAQVFSYLWTVNMLQAKSIAKNNGNEPISDGTQKSSSPKFDLAHARRLEWSWRMKHGWPIPYRIF